MHDVTARRGPSGEAPPPPAWLSERSLPIQTIKAGSVLHRVHGRSFDANFFGPGKGRPATYRFDSATGIFRVLYTALDFTAAVAETMLRNPELRLVSALDIEHRSYCEITLCKDLRVVPLYGIHLQQVGTDNAISTGPYDVCGLWADTLHEHKDNPDGIAYRSRHVSDHTCVAVFDRAASKLNFAPSQDLRQQFEVVAALLESLGKEVV